MRPSTTVLTLASALLFASATASASTTKAPLTYTSIEPCRVLDTRNGLGGNPLPAGSFTDVFVRGNNLPPQGGVVGCKVPANAEAVMLNVTTVGPTANGNLKLNATGFVNNFSPYARVTFTAGENVSNEILVGLCNVNAYPHPHEPCGGPTTGRYADMQMQVNSAAGSTTHVVIDIIGFTSRMPYTSLVWGTVVDKQNAAGDPSAILLVLDNELRIVCTLPWTEHTRCDIPIGWAVRAVGHVDNFEGVFTVYAHRELGVTEQ